MVDMNNSIIGRLQIASENDKCISI